MRHAALLKKEKIEKLFVEAQKLKIANFKNRFLSSQLAVESPFEKLYLLKKLYSILYCLIENNLLEEQVHPKLVLVLKKSSKLYFYFILEMQTNFHKINRHFLLLLLCKHLAILFRKLRRRLNLPNLISKSPSLEILFSQQTQNETGLTREQRLAMLVDKFGSQKTVLVSNTTILSGHDTTINTILTFLQAEPFDINNGFKRLTEFYNYPPRFGSTLAFQLELCSECSSNFRVAIKYDFEEIVPFFCQERGNCDLFKFLAYVDKVEDFDMKSKENEFQYQEFDNEF